MNEARYKQRYGVLEHKFSRLGSEVHVKNGIEISGYASIFGVQDQGGDTVAKGAYAASLQALKSKGRSVKMLWQHNPAQPIGIWDEVYEDAKGLYVKGRLLLDVEKGREAAALIEAGAIDGLSIGYRTVRAANGGAHKGGKASRILSELELWEVSLVTFPMLPEARLGADAKGNDPAEHQLMRDVAQAFTHASALLKE